MVYFLLITEREIRTDIGQNKTLTKKKKKKKNPNLEPHVAIFHSCFLIFPELISREKSKNLGEIRYSRIAFY